MNDPASGKGTAPEAGTSDAARYYKRDFWDKENLKFSEPWYRLEKSAQLINGLPGAESALSSISVADRHNDATAIGKYRILWY